MDIIAYKGKTEINRDRIMSIGGGSIKFENTVVQKALKVYNFDKFNTIADYCKKNSKRLWEYVLECEDSEFYKYMENIWTTMKLSIQSGLLDEGTLPGGLDVQKRQKFCLIINI